MIAPFRKEQLNQRKTPGLRVGKSPPGDSVVVFMGKRY